MTTPEAFDGIHGVLVVGKRDKSQRKYTDIHEHTVSVLNRVGFIPSDLWLACQNKPASDRQLKNSGTHTWLSGLLKSCCR